MKGFNKGHIPWNKGKKHSLETIKKISLSKTNPSQETRNNLSIARRKRINKDYKGKFNRICLECKIIFKVFFYLKDKAKYCSASCRAIAVGKTKRGKNHFRYIKDRTKLVKKQIRNDYAYQDWRKQVWQRDNWKCKISNQDCKGRLEAHHILPWRDYPELRYDPNNGITLCHAHHPRKRAEEKKLIPTFQELVSVLKV